MAETTPALARLVERNTQLTRDLLDHAKLLTPDTEEQVFAMVSAFTTLVELKFGPRRALDVTMTLLAPALAEWDAARSGTIQ